MGLKTLMLPFEHQLQKYPPSSTFTYQHNLDKSHALMTTKESHVVMDMKKQNQRPSFHKSFNITFRTSLLGKMSFAGKPRRCLFFSFSKKDGLHLMVKELCNLNEITSELATASALKTEFTFYV